MTGDDLTFDHRFQPSPRGSASPVFLLLHGTGGDENDLMPLAAVLGPVAAVLSPRGKVNENGMPRFFRRLAEGVFDVEDLHRRTHELADFVEAAAVEYQFNASRVIAVGFSNGANIAASMLLLRPETLLAAILFHAMVPFEPDQPLNVKDKPIFMGAGEVDPLIPPAKTQRLAAIFREAGARVTIDWEPVGHVLPRAEVESAARWLTAEHLLDVES